jgi:phage baseplate assembly protein W
MATIDIENTRTFRDLDLNFTIHPVRKDINVHKNEYAVINSIKNLILTNHYERPFQPEIGSNIRRLLFETSGYDYCFFHRKRNYNRQVTNYEPRAKISRINSYGRF